MKDLLVICGTMKDEVNETLNKIKQSYDTILIESELHNFPDRLRLKLQEIINENTLYENIILVYGCCGNALVGLQAIESNIAIPKTDDCISLMLSGNKNYSEMRKKTYFLTKTWIESTKSIFSEFDHMEKKYGEKRANSVMKQMFKNYENLMLIDNGTYNTDDFLPIANDFANKLNLDVIVEKGSLDFLERLLLKKWERDFIIIKKGDKVDMNDFY